ncbi:unnamed protein product [Leptosia nina]|uniref:RecA family profile 1 domain-containing protein n=1 Tax=Leptosia nina TaxID=320188 RepID=A0AAV1JMA0_9NEOP
MKNEDITLLKNIIGKQICPLINTAEEMTFEKHINTGCVSVDKLLNGGLRVGTLTEVYGESGSGKTQLALQIAAQCGSKGSVYICTESVFPVKRFNQICDYIQRDSCKNINKEHTFIEHVTEGEDLLSCIRVRLPKLLKQKKISVIIIDSIASPFRIDVSNYVQRAEELRELGISLLNLAQNFNLAILCLNQVTSSFEKPDNILPSLGLSWSNMVSYRLLLRRSSCLINIDNIESQIRELIVMFSPDLDNKMCKFAIDTTGLKSLPA